MTTTYISAEIEGFAAKVREHLADLNADEIEELTGGLEADLAEELHERHVDSSLRDPARYAMELRMAAGLPPRLKAKARPVADFVTGVRDKRTELAADLRRNPMLASVMDFAVSLRPFWWLLRAWVAFQLVAVFFGLTSGVLPASIFGMAILLIFGATSVQLGRGVWSRFAATGALIVAGNVVAVLLLAPVLVYGSAFGNSYGGTVYAEADPINGLSIDGELITNVYAYDVQGKPIEGAQLFDQAGQPLVISDEVRSEQCIEEDCSEPRYLIPGMLETGASAWNIFPLRAFNHGEMVYNEETGDYEPKADAQAAIPPAPFVKVPAVAPTKNPPRGTK